MMQIGNGIMEPLTAEIIESSEEASYRVAKAVPMSEVKNMSVEEYLDATTPIYQQVCKERLEREEKERLTSKI